MGVDRRQLRPHRADAQASNRAWRLAEQWRAAGLAVEMVEYLNPDSEPGGYVLTGRSRTSVISCRCEIWLYRRLPWGGRTLWTIIVSIRSAHPQADIGAPPPPPARQVGFAAAWDHDAAWEIVQAWIDGAAPLPSTLADALAALPH
jgi:hypothetical protein